MNRRIGGRGLDEPTYRGTISSVMNIAYLVVIIADLTSETWCQLAIDAPFQTQKPAFLGLIRTDFGHSGLDSDDGRRPTCRYSRPVPGASAFIQTVNFGFFV